MSRMLNRRTVRLLPLPTLISQLNGPVSESPLGEDIVGPFDTAFAPELSAVGVLEDAAQILVGWYHAQSRASVQFAQPLLSFFDPLPRRHDLRCYFDHFPFLSLGW